MQRKTGAHLWDAAEAAKLVREFAGGKTEEEFISDLVVRSAIERQLEILGEALKRLRRDDADTAARVPGLERIVGLRNVLAHEYGDIDYEILWLATTTEIPGLITILNELVDEARDATGL
ncbi:DUF86 domain-containing protein [Brevibacterium sediminis]|uniref:HepT-like ribonuclease domain-containing protein n=1 Tax=Brevibacterium sediminis TaxID=1857024 RepID=UPI0021752767|nr:HepT-like ribonuclease domain-containing protein [Brevibacterium sediminis]MCS4593409.1 DUF86 domain-containing protein [Brevibacterium sediminis]